MVEPFNYAFMQHAFLAGIMVAGVCPVIGLFLVVRRLALIGDGLGHISFAGVAAGWLWGIYPVYTAALFAVCGGIGIEMLRQKQRQYADMVLAVIFYTGIALAILFTSMVRTTSGSNLLSYLFGSIVTVSDQDVKMVYILGGTTLLVIALLYRQFIYVSCDEETARVNGLRVACLNILLVVLTAVTVSVAMRVVGILLVSALMIVPVAASMHLGRSFAGTMGWAVFFGEMSVIAGLYASFYFDYAPGGTIVLASVVIYLLVLLAKMASAGLRTSVPKKPDLKM